MNQVRFLIVILVACLVFTTGCGVKNQKYKPYFKDTFKTRNELASTAASDSAPVVPGIEKPIVRIINGTAMDDTDATRLISGADTPEKRAPHTQLRSMILRHVPVRLIAELLTDLSGINVVATDKVADREIAVYLKRITVNEALDALCRLNDIWYREDRGVMTLMSREEFVADTENRQSDQNRAFFIRYTNAADMAKVIQSAMGDQVYLNVIDDEKIYGHIDPEEAAQVGQGASDDPALSGKVVLDGAITDGKPALSIQPVDKKAEAAPMAGQKGTDKPLLAILTVFKRNNCILARSLDSRLLDEMEKIVAALDTPTSQVLLEIRILQLTLDDGFESFFDFNWSDAVNTLGVLGTKGVGPTSVNFLYDKDKIQSRLAYFKTKGRAETVSTPFLMAANNSKVEFFVGEETPLRDDVTSSTVSLGENNVVTTFKVEIVRKELGTDIEMTTFINEDSTVTLEFEAKIDSAILNYSTVGVVNDMTGEIVEFPLDGTSKSEIKSILTAKSGQSIAIGGIIKENIQLTDNHVPIMGDIPLLGFFFKEIEKTKRKTETVIVLTPHVIDHPARGGGVSGQFLSRKSSHQQITQHKENILVPGDGENRQEESR